jgi:hypothetical protein
MGDNPKPKPWTRAEFDAQLMQASKEALKRWRELLESMKARSDLRAGTAPTNARLAELRRLGRIYGREPRPRTPAWPSCVRS